MALDAEQQAAPPPKVVRTALDLIEEHPEWSWTTTDLAREVGIGSVLSKRLQEARGASPPADVSARSPAKSCTRRTGGIVCGRRHCRPHSDEVGLWSSRPLRYSLSAQVRRHSATHPTRDLNIASKQLCPRFVRTAEVGLATIATPVTETQHGEHANHTCAKSPGSTAGSSVQAT